MTESYYPKFANSGPAPEVTPPSVQTRGPSGARWLYAATSVTIARAPFGDHHRIVVLPGWIAGSILRAVEEQDPHMLAPP